MSFTDSIRMVDVAIVDQDLLSATPEYVSNSKMFIGTTKHLETGTLPELPEKQNTTISAGSSVEVPYGINRRSYIITAEGLDGQTPGTATSDKILNNYTAWVNGIELTGTMPNIGQESAEIDAGQSHTISVGYHNGTGIITAKPLSEQTPGDATSDNILTGKTAWVNGSLVSGSMNNNGSIHETLQAGEIYNFTEGYYQGSSFVEAANLASQTQANANSSQILSGKTAWVNGNKITGSMVNNGSYTNYLSLNGIVYIPQGYHDGFGYITQDVPAMEGITLAPTQNSYTVTTAGYTMTGNITVKGVDALMYQRTGAIMKDANGDDISNYTLTVSNNKATVSIYVDNWHDNATFNVYNITFNNLIDAHGNLVDLNCAIPIDWTNQTKEDYVFGEITVSIELESGTNAHLITVDGINSGKITIVEMISCRQFGTQPVVYYSVEFESNGGTPVPSQTIEASGLVEEPADPTREGYDFICWCSDVGLMNEYDFDTPVINHLTLYAKWELTTLVEEP